MKGDGGDDSDHCASRRRRAILGGHVDVGRQCEFRNCGHNHGFPKPSASDRQSLGGRRLSLILGLDGRATALYDACLSSLSMWDQYTKILGLFGGGMAGLFAAGVFTRWTNGPGIVLGSLASVE